MSDTSSVARPCPRGHWLLGCLAEFRRDKLAFYQRLAREHGPVAFFRLGWRRLALVSEPAFIEQILVIEHRNFVKPYIYQFLRPVLGNGLLLSEGAFWLRQRRLMQPAFSRQRSEAYAPLMVEHATRMLDGWRAGETRDLQADLSQLALRIVTQALLGVNLAEEAQEVAPALEFLMEDFSYRFESACPLPTWLPGRWNRRLRQVKQQLNDVLARIIQRHRADGTARGDLLATLIQARDEDNRVMTDRQLRDEVMTLFLAGHETTANALTWAWYLLAQHPDCDRRLQEEVTTVLNGRLPTAADLPRLPFAERVVLEAMRLYPPVYTFSREAVADCQLGDLTIPAGTTLLLSQWVMHRDPRFFAEPERFVPDRWADGLAQRLPRYAYFPFGGGPRVCIGSSFALVEAVLVLVTMAQRYRLQLVPGGAVRPWASITLRPATPIRVIVEVRNTPAI